MSVLAAVGARPPAARRGHKPGMALAVIAASQLMIVLDATIVNIALPDMQKGLGFSTTSLSWVLNAYTLTFGGLLLLGGRAGDILGRRRVFIFGILLFSVASLLGGFATSSGWLLAMRALQGVGGAIASPTALSLITTNFSEGSERNRAFGVFAAVSGSGAALGLLAGGILTSYLSWRWVLFVNAPIGLLLALAAPLYINESERRPGRFDATGALISTLGMTSLVYGFIRAAQDGWQDGLTIMSFVAAVVLLAAFIRQEQRSKQPIVPLWMFRDRNRVGSYTVMLGLAAGLFGMFFFLTLFVQGVLEYSPLKAGLAFLPVSAAVVVAAQFTSRMLVKLGPQRFMIGGATLTTVGLIWLAQISVSSGYVMGLLLPMLLFGLGMGFLFVPLTIVALSKVDDHESGAASGLLTTMQQVGGSLGLSILVTVFGTASRNEGKVQVANFLSQADNAAVAQFQKTGKLPKAFADQVLAHGVSSAFTAAIVFSIISLIAAVVLIRAKASDFAGADHSEQTEASPEIAEASNNNSAGDAGKRRGGGAINPLPTNRRD